MQFYIVYYHSPQENLADLRKARHAMSTSRYAHYREMLLDSCNREREGYGAATYDFIKCRYCGNETQFLVCPVCEEKWENG